MKMHYDSPNCRILVSEQIYLVSEDGCPWPTDAETLIATGALPAATLVPKPSVTASALLRKFFKGVHTVTRELCTEARRLHYYLRATRVRLEGSPGSREFAESYAAAI